MAYIIRLIIILIFISVSVCDAATYYIRDDGHDTNCDGLSDEAAGDGTCAWLTVSKAFSEVAAGDTVNIASGTYAGTANTSTSGSDGSPITLTGQEDESTIITGEWTIDKSWYTIQNMYFNGDNLVLAGVDADYNVIDSNKFMNNPYGIQMTRSGSDDDGVNGPSYNTISNNEFSYGGGDSAVTIIGTDNVIEDNNFHDLNGYDALHIWGVGTIIRDNAFTDICSGPNADPPNTNHVDIIQSWNSSTSVWAKDILFERNKIVNCSGQWGNITGLRTDGVNSDHMEDWVFRNNVLINSRAELYIRIQGVQLYNNTIIGNPYPNGPHFGQSETYGYAHDAVVLNNIFLQCEGTYDISLTNTGQVNGYNLVTASDDGADNSATVLRQTAGINGGYTPAEVFADPSNDDVTLVFGSPAIDAGCSTNCVGVDITALFTTDYLEATRGATWEIGAYEFEGEGQASGTIIPGGCTESEIVSGGKTIVITLSGDEWVADGATFEAQRQNIIDGMDSGGEEAGGWDAVVKAELAVTTVVRTSATIVTITLPDFDGDPNTAYAITANETVTVTIPATAVVGAVEIVATPTFQISAELVAPENLSIVYDANGPVGVYNVNGKVITAP